MITALKNILCKHEYTEKEMIAPCELDFGVVMYYGWRATCNKCGKEIEANDLELPEAKQHIPKVPRTLRPPHWYDLVKMGVFENGKTKR